MIIDLALIGEDGRRFAGEETSDGLALEGDEFRVSGPVSCDFFAQLASNSLIVSGTWQVPVDLECARCGDFFSTTIKDSSFLRDYAVSDEVASVDITDDIRESVLLKLPHYPVCGNECKGLCPQCGKNLNREECNCSAPQTEGSWDALDHLNID